MTSQGKKLPSSIYFLILVAKVVTSPNVFLILFTEQLLSFSSLPYLTSPSSSHSFSSSPPFTSPLYPSVISAPSLFFLPLLFSSLSSPSLHLLTSRETYNALTNWLTDARTLASPNIVIVMVGNKRDLESDREVTFMEASRFAQENGRLHSYIQWNPSITDTIGTQHFVCYSEVSPTQGLPVYFR